MFWIARPRSVALETLQRFVPAVCNDPYGLAIQTWSNQRIHLRHIAAKPKEIAAGGGQHEQALNQLLLRPPWCNDGSANANGGPQGGKEEYGQYGGSHVVGSSSVVAFTWREINNSFRNRFNYFSLVVFVFFFFFCLTLALRYR